MRQPLPGIRTQRPRARRGADEPIEEFKNAKNSQPGRNQSIVARTLSLRAIRTG
jgi:hypothetical protein